MKQKLIYKNENIKRYKSKFKKDQNRRVYTSFGVDRNTKYKGLSLCEYNNGEKYLGVRFRLRKEKRNVA